MKQARLFYTDPEVKEHRWRIFMLFCMLICDDPTFKVLRKRWYQHNYYRERKLFPQPAPVKRKRKQRIKSLQLKLFEGETK